MHHNKSFNFITFNLIKIAAMKKIAHRQTDAALRSNG
jgi:hypothetical protein